MSIKKIPFFIQTPWVGAIGNMSEEIYYGLLRARRENRKVLFLFPYDLFKPFVFSKFGLGINSELKKIESVYRLGKYNNPLIILLNILLTLFCCVLIVIDMTIGKFVALPRWFRVPHIGSEFLWKRKRGEKYSSKKVEEWNWEKELKNFLEINLPVASVCKAEEIRVKMGLPMHAWFVCLHVREGGYYSQVKGYKEGRGKVVRNSSIENYIDAIKYIVRSGGWVVRLGDSNMTPLPEINNVIDYPFTQYKCDLMDIYLLKKCDFFLGPRSGIADTAIMFQKPMVFVNHIANVGFNPVPYGSLVIYKHIFHKKLSRLLSLKEMLSFSLKDYDYMDTVKYDLIENSKEEILDVVKEFVNYKFNGINYSNEQKQWIEKCKNNGVCRFNNLKYTETSDDTKFRYSPYLFGSLGTVGSCFYDSFYHNK